MTKIILILLLTLPQAFAEDGKKLSEEQFKQHLSETAKIRQQQADEMYQLKKALLEEEYKDQKKIIEEINALSLQMKFGDREHNKNLKRKMKEKFKTLKSERKDHREKIKSKREEFKDANKDRRKKIRKMMEVSKE